MDRTFLALAAFLRHLKSSNDDTRISGRRRALLTIVFALLSAIIWPTGLFAQDIQNPQNSVDFKKRSSAHVDPATLAMQLQIPLGSYQGRGGMSFPITLNYSSKLWRIGYSRTDGGINGGDPTNIFDGFYGESSAAGWTSSLDWFLWPTINDSNGATHYYGFEQPLEMYETNGKAATGSKFQRTVARMHVVLLDGSRHELRRDDIVLAGQPGVDTKSGTFYAVDGSQLRFESASKTLFMPDGSRIIYDANNDGTPAAIRYIDRNGNQNTYNFATTQCNRWTDTLGRTFNIDLLVRCDGARDIQAGEKTYTLPGVNGVALNYTMRWSQLYGPNGESVLDGPVPDEANRPYVGDHTSTGAHSPLSPSLFTTSLSDSLIVSGSARFNPVVLSQIVLPNGTAYTFKYNTYGEIVRIEYPTGGYETFSYDQVESLSGHIDDPLYAQANRGVVAQSTSAGAGAQVSTWTYGTTINTSQTPLRLARTIKSPDDSCTVILYHKSRNDAIMYGFDEAIVGKPYDERVYAQCPSPAGDGGVMVRRKLTQWGDLGPQQPGGYSGAKRNSRILKEVEILLDAGSTALTKTTLYRYDQASQPLNVTSVTEYGFVTMDKGAAQTADISAFNPDPSLAVRTTETAYLDNPDYKARQLISLPTSKTIHSGSLTGPVVARTEMSYDENQIVSGVSLSSWVDPGTTAPRGNLTSVRSLADLSTNRYITTHVEYDQFGNAIKSQDGKGKITQVEYGPQNAYAYPTGTTSPDPDDGGPAQPLTSSTAYDFSTGLVLSTTDANQQVTNYEYNDPLNRLKRVVRPVGGGATSYEYGDTPGDLYIKTSTTLDASRALVTTRKYDGLGRSISVSQSEGTTSIYSDTQYDVMGRVWKVSNPYRSGETPLLTVTSYDLSGRVIKVTTPDGAQVLTSYDAVPGSNATGAPVMVTDQAGKKRGTITDAFGRLIQVVEDPGTGGGTLAPLAHQTNYEYDVLGNLRTVTQGAQTRTFIYDALSRLKSATNPESGTVSYNYDDNGNLVSKTDARPITITYVYDHLNRITNRSYSDASTPSVTYTYDNLANAKGRLTSVQSAVSQTAYDEFDAMGRIKRSTQTTGGTPYVFPNYDYDLAGNLTSETYPSGRVVATEYDGAGRVAGVHHQGSSTYYAGGAANDTVNRIQYSAHGAVKKMRLGNGLWEQVDFNGSLQPTEISLGSESNPSSVLKLSYDYGASDNNGNVRSQTITVPGLANPLVQSYSYDLLNRIQSMSETGGLSQSFDYDRYGNRIITAGYVQDTAHVPHPTQSAPGLADWYDPQTNRLKSERYDGAGNIIKDTVDANAGNSFEYDGENKQIRYNGGAAAGGADYQYDGDGRRVRKVSGNVTTIFVYDAGGQLVAEYSTSTPEGSGGMSYLTSDSLGTPRVITDAQGTVKARHDYLPFGEEIAVGVGGRTTGQKYVYGAGDDSVRQKFTKKERDVETGLDYFNARYYSSIQGRFTSPDTFTGTALNPQTLNLYAYVQNNPLKFTDPTGHYPQSYGAGDILNYFYGERNNRWMVQTQGQGSAPKPATVLGPDGELPGDGGILVIDTTPGNQDDGFTIDSPNGATTVNGGSRVSNAIGAILVTTARQIRAPDAVQVNWGLLFFGQTFTYDSYGRSYSSYLDFYPRKPLLGSRGKFGLPKINFRFGASVALVYINQIKVPTPEESRNAFAGPSVTLQGGYRGVGGQFSISPTTGTSTTGFGASTTGIGGIIGDAQQEVGQGWGWR